MAQIILTVGHCETMDFIHQPGRDPVSGFTSVHLEHQQQRGYKCSCQLQLMKLKFLQIDFPILHVESLFLSHATLSTGRTDIHHNSASRASAHYNFLVFLTDTFSWFH